ncbi:MAG: carbohydrate ABC transporter substrate-binding protein, partial [Oscillospiraceae bacterium]|nr:carbohydrate ABC transporter substrate-binding protein [Oscillospiraceae bacterium]
MKKLLAIVLALTMVIAFAACGVSTESAAPAASGGDSQAAAPAASGVKLYNGKIEIATALDHAAEVYEAATGKHVEVESLGGGIDLQAQLKQYWQAGNMPDIFVFEGAPDLA